MRDSHEVLSARIKAVKYVSIHRRSVFYMAEGFASPLLWWELEKANYPLRRNDKNAVRKLEQDYNRVCQLNSSREDDLSRIFWHGIEIIFGQPRNQQKNLLVAWCTVCRISLGNESPNVMCSVRAREAFQTAAFPQLKLMERKAQNPKLIRLEELGLGEFHKGEAYKRTDAGIFKLLAAEDESTTYPSLFTSLTSLLEMHTGSLLVGCSPKEAYLLVMDQMDAGFKAFLGYTISQKEVNAAAKDEFKAANPLPKAEPKPKKEYKPRKYNASKMEKMLIAAGKAEIQDNKLVMLSEPTQQETPDFSYLLDEPVTLEQVRQTWTTQEDRYNKFLTADIEF